MRLHLIQGYKAAQEEFEKFLFIWTKNLQEKLRTWVNQGIIRWMRNDEQPEWVNSYVLVTKKAPDRTPENMVSAEKVRRIDIPAKRIMVCLDPRELNEALIRKPYYIESVDKLTTKIHSVQYFSVVNMEKGFWHIMLHPDSQVYTAMSLPSGRYIWTRLPMGLVDSSDEFQKKLDAVYNGKPGLTGIADDMIITGKSREDHEHNFLNF